MTATVVWNKIPSQHHSYFFSLSLSLSLFFWLRSAFLVIACNIWEKQIQILPSEQCLFRDGLASSSNIVLKLVLHPLQKHGFVVKECMCWICLKTVQNLNQTKIFSRSLSQSKSDIRQKWDIASLPEHQQLVSTVPTWMYTVVKRNRDATQRSTSPCLNFLRHVTAIKFKMTWFFS